jgi:putative PIN family toxin of toxin-antitoxin system
MADRRKVVLDANVIVSAAMGGRPDRAVQKAEAMTVLISPPIEAELSGLSDELASTLTPDQRRLFQQRTRRVLAKATRVTIPGRLHLCRDPKDDAYLETCQVGRSHFLVTGDRDLLEVDRDLLKKHRLGRLTIVTPAQFLETA